ncbi:hypothetical protein NDU88_013050 [Pleurodeles waltl]|uniref:Uncharacterized protein n=1 Tax=Pleurodeles waltl TaxID=8319 RepID=A0AAV7R3J1_PLEWA|nr:hypothetical protein NDU88_013050 [Pleurodeles waltl]
MYYTYMTQFQSHVHALKSGECLESNKGPRETAVRAGCTLSIRGADFTSTLYIRDPAPEALPGLRAVPSVPPGTPAPPLLTSSPLGTAMWPPSSSPRGPWPPSPSVLSRGRVQSRGPRRTSSSAMESLCSRLGALCARPHQPHPPAEPKAKVKALERNVEGGN